MENHREIFGDPLPLQPLWALKFLGQLRCCRKSPIRSLTPPTDRDQVAPTVKKWIWRDPT